MRLLPRIRQSPQAALSVPPSVAALLRSGHTAFPMIASPPQNAAITRAYQRMQSATLAHIWRTQPAVRQVIHYIASNLSQLTLQLYDVAANGRDREQDFTHPALRTFERPAPRTPGRQWIYDLTTDFLIYNNAYALKRTAEENGPRTLLRLPAAAVSVDGGFYLPERYTVYSDAGEIPITDPDEVLHVTGYSPDDPLAGFSALETLRTILVEESTNQAASIERLKSGGLRDGYIKRSLEAADWDDEDAERFVEFWQAQTAANSAGVREGIPVLEEGMEFVESKISPKDAQLLESRRFTREEVAAVYGMKNCPPESTEEREQFYTDVLPPIAQTLADQFDLHVCEIEYGRDDLRFAFNFQDKLRGSIAERFKTWTNAAGAPILLRNEARREEGLPPVDGGDELITPLNVIEGKPSVAAMPAQNPIGPEQDGSGRSDAVQIPIRHSATSTNGNGTTLVVDQGAAKLRTQALEVARREGMKRRRDNYALAHREILARHFKRQRQIFRSSGRFDAERFNAELADDLEAEALATVEREGEIAAARLASDFSIDRARNYLRAGAEERAKAINATTQNRIEASNSAGAQAAEPADDADEDPFSDADNRAEEGGLSMGTALAGFAMLEAGKQAPDAALRQKTWLVMSGNSRHPTLSGETVPVHATFSNGGQHPGDPALGVEETARCQCLLEVI